MSTSQHTRAKLYRAPARIDAVHGRSVFLAGSITGTGDWQSAVTQRLADLPITIFNPRRDDWDASWVQRSSDPRFYEQTTWELDQQARADVIALFLHPDTKAPVSLLELGLSAHTGKVVVCCPDGFYLKGYVEVVCERLGMDLVDSLDALVGKVKEKLQC